MKNSPALGELTESHDNNFNLIRIVAAIAVLVAHSFTLVTGDAENEPHLWIFGKSVGSMAVDFFFVASGLLITSSLFRRPNFKEYALARMLRIFPALIVANSLCIFLLGPFVTQDRLGTYFFSLQTFKFLIFNNSLLLGVQYQLPGVFTENPFPRAVNGSLWTLPHELRMYICISLTYYLAGLIAGKRRAQLLTVLVPSIALIGLLIHFIGKYAAINYLHGQKWPWLLFLFFAGASLFVHRDKLKLSTYTFIFCLALLSISTYNKPLFDCVYSLVLPYIVIYLAYIPKGIIRMYNHMGDYSYGVYIYAFPIQQLIIFLYPNVGILSMVVSSFFATGILALLSWNFVEKPSLAMKKSASMFLMRIRFRNAS